MLEPPPNTLPIDNGIDRPLTRALGSAGKPPIPVTTEIFRPLVRPYNGVHIIATASFQEQHTDIGIFRKSASHHRSR